MVRDPYDVLGVPRNASQDEVKKAYRKKVRECHPDLHPDDPHAEERMSEVNGAYDRIMNPEKYTRERAREAGYGQQGPFGGGYNPYGGYGQQQGNSNPYGSGQQQYEWGGMPFNWEDIFGAGFGGAAGDPSTIHPEASPKDSAELRAAVDCINSRQYMNALNALNKVAKYDRGARWNYLASLANYGVGNTSLAYQQIRNACTMDPNSMEYRRALQAFQQPSQAYGQQTQQQGFDMGMNPCLSSCCCMSWLSACMPCGMPFLCCI